MTARQWRVELLHEAVFAAKVYIAAAVLGAALVLVGAQFGVSFVQLQTAPQSELPDQQELPDPVKHLPNDIKSPDSISSNPVLLSGRRSQFPSQVLKSTELREIQEITEERLLRIESLKKTIERGVIVQGKQALATNILSEIIGLAAGQRAMVGPHGPFAIEIDQLLRTVVSKAAAAPPVPERHVALLQELRNIQEENKGNLDKYDQLIDVTENKNHYDYNSYLFSSIEGSDSKILNLLNRLEELLQTDRALTERVMMLRIQLGG